MGRGTDSLSSAKHLHSLSDISQAILVFCAGNFALLLVTFFVDCPVFCYSHVNGNQESDQPSITCSNQEFLPWPVFERDSQS